MQQIHYSYSFFREGKSNLKYLKYVKTLQKDFDSKMRKVTVMSFKHFAYIIINQYCKIRNILHSINIFKC